MTSRRHIYTYILSPNTKSFRPFSLSPAAHKAKVIFSPVFCLKLATDYILLCILDFILPMSQHRLKEHCIVLLLVQD